jgi:futalosine hydrolase
VRPRLIVSATRLEAELLLDSLEDRADLPLPYGQGTRGSRHGVRLVVAWLGVGKANTAAGLALAVQSLDPVAVIQVGIGGAFPDSGLEPGSAAVASEEVHLDLGAATEEAFEDLEALGFPLLALPGPIYNRVPLASELAGRLAAGRWPSLPFGTAETVSGTAAAGERLAARFGVAVESMEGAAAAQVCLALGVPFGEVRGVSNRVGERDKECWRVGPALEEATEVIEHWLLAGAPVPPAEG